MGENRISKKRCNQCWTLLPKSAFQGPKENHEYQDCDNCRKNGRKPINNHRTGLPTASELRVLFTEHSTNAKLGDMPSCKVTASTCPISCAWFNHGCFGESHILRERWRRVESDGIGWVTFLNAVGQLPKGQVWRYAEVGDLPGQGESIDEMATLALVEANRGRRGFTYTHKRGHPSCSGMADLKRLIDYAKQEGFTINLSCDSLEQVDYYRFHGFTSLAVTLPSDAPDKLTTPDGYTVQVCWAERDDTTTCARCKACANPSASRAVIGFRAHGQCKKWVSSKANTLAYQSATSRTRLALPVVK